MVISDNSEALSTNASVRIVGVAAAVWIKILDPGLIPETASRAVAYFMTTILSKPKGAGTLKK